MVKRRELKYIITEEEFLRIRPVLDAVMEPDRHMENGRYTVRSKYFDSIDSEEWQATLDGLAVKRKIRIRIYSLDAPIAKLECKCKNNMDGAKFYLQISRNEVKELEQNRYDFLLDKPNELAHKLYVRMASRCYRPKTVLQYQRTAYRYPAGDVRITFDRDIKGSMGSYSIYDEYLPYVPLLDADKGVLEIKYSGLYPRALMSMLGMLDSTTQAYSKYSMSMEESL